MITIDQTPINGVFLLFVSLGLTFVLNLASSYWPVGEERKKITRLASPPGFRAINQSLFSRAYLVATSFFWGVGTFLIFFTTNQNRIAYWIFASFYGAYLVLDKFWYHFYFYNKSENSKTIGMVFIGLAFLLSVGMLVDFLVGQMLFRNTLCGGAPSPPFVCGNYGIALAGAIVFFIHIGMYVVLVRRVVENWSR
jgi:hypothetical protein